jgi:hypothetical protein
MWRSAGGICASWQELTSTRPPKPAGAAHSLRVPRSVGRDRRANQPTLRLGEGLGAAFAPAQAVGAEFRAASAPNLAMLVVPGCQSASGAGREGRAVPMSNAITMGG